MELSLIFFVALLAGQQKRPPSRRRQWSWHAASILAIRSLPIGENGENVWIPT